MKKLILAIAVLGIAALTLIAATALGRPSRHNGRAHLSSYQEVPTLSSTGEGSLRLRIRGDTIHYVLRFEGLETDSLVAHIHFGRPATTGGVAAFLCGGGDKPACPLRAGTVENDIDSADVIGPVAQGIEPGAMDELIRAIRVGATYANVHTVHFPAGEIRGVIR